MRGHNHKQENFADSTHHCTNCFYGLVKQIKSEEIPHFYTDLDAVVEYGPSAT